MPQTAKHQIWKSAGHRRQFGYKTPKNMIEHNIRNIKKMNNINLLNSIHHTADIGQGRLSIQQKANMTKNGVERGDNFVFFKRSQAKRQRFNETRPNAKSNRRALSCIGVEKIKVENPKQEKLKERFLKRPALTPNNLRSLSVRK